MVRLHTGQQLSNVDREVLTALLQGPGHGYGIGQEIGRDRQTVSASLRRMAVKAYVRRQQDAEGGYPPRRVYRVTEAGKAVLAKETG